MIEQLLKECEYIAKNPKKIISEYINKNNKKAVGMVPLFGPEELVDAAGMLPVGLWGGYNVEIDLAKQYFPAFCASMVNVIMELGRIHSIHSSFTFLFYIFINFKLF